MDPRRFLAVSAPAILVSIGVGIGFGWHWALVTGGSWLLLAGWKVPLVSSVGALLAGVGLSIFGWWIVLIWLGAVLAIAIGGYLAAAALRERLQLPSSPS